MLQSAYANYIEEAVRKNDLDALTNNFPNELRRVTSFGQISAEIVPERLHIQFCGLTM